LNTNEAKLLSEAKKFDQNALAEIYDVYSPGLYRYAYRQLGSQEIAEECVAETFSRFLNALKRDKGPSQNLRAYLYRIAHNWITDQFRRKSLPTEPLKPEIQSSPGQLPEKIVDTHMTKELIRTHLSQLTPDQRQVLTLKFIEGWNNEEIAASLKKPVGAVKALQHRGLKNLRKRLKDHFEDKA
jgi:RNA polymerase sigma-70 factor (ECF subfamily)